MSSRQSIRFVVAALLVVGCGGGGGGIPSVGGRGGGTAAGHGGTGGSGGASGGRGGSGGGAGTSAGGAAGTSAGAGGSSPGGSGGSAVSGSGGSSAGTGGTGGGAGTGGSSSGGGLVDLIDNAAGTTIAIDSSGTIHVAAAAIVQGNYVVVYARCASQCSQAASWTFLALPLESSTSYVPTIALTANGRPRIAYASDLGSAPGFHYLQCDTGCDQVANWSDVRLTMGDPGANPVPRPSMPFAVSPGGAAAFVYEDGFGMYAWFCPASCAQGASWTRVTLADVYVYPEAAAFASDQSLQIVARHGIQNDESLLWLDCSGDCSAIASWAQVDGLWQVHGQLREAIARTSTGGTRIVFYGDDPSTAAVENVFGYLVCESNCRAPASWKPPLLLGIPPGAGDVGFGLALDSGAHPTIAILGGTASSLARCSGDCTGAAGTWQLTASVGTSTLNGGFTPTVPAGCTSASWGMYVGPSLALAANGNPAMAITAQAKAFGGTCGTGSAATVTSSFLLLP